MKKWLFYYIITFNLFLFGQKSTEDIELLKQIVSKRENHILNKSKNIKWQEYNHSLLTANIDKITKLVDTIWKNKETGRFNIDSSSFKFKNFNIHKHFYQSERNINHERKNFKHRSIITKFKIGGFEQPIYETLALELFSHSIYDNDFYFIHNQMIHPLSNKGLKKYYFNIQIQKNYYLIDFHGVDRKDIYGWFMIDKESKNIKEAVIQKSGFLAINVHFINNYDNENDSWLPSETIMSIKKGERAFDLKILDHVVYMKSDRNKDFFFRPFIF